MSIKDFIFNITKPIHISAYEYKQEYFNKMLSAQSSLTATEQELSMCNIDLDKQKNIIEKLNDELESLKNQIELPINKALSKFKEIPNIAYSDKRAINNKEIPVYLNQMITPDSFSVLKLKKSISAKDVYSFNVACCNKIAKSFSYISDIGDSYAYPEEAIINNGDDCETHAQTVASLNYEYMGFAYGHAVLNGKKTGHSWVIFSDENNQLYEAETTGFLAKVWKYGTNKDYDPVFIVTKDKTFRIKSGEFGKRVY